MQPQEKPTKSIRDAMRDAAIVGTKTGRSDYVHISTLAEVLRWQQGFEALLEACERLYNLNAAGVFTLPDEHYIAITRTAAAIAKATEQP